MTVTIRTIVGAMLPMCIIVGATTYFIPPKGRSGIPDRDDAELRSTLIAGVSCVGLIALLLLLGGHLR
ncbi:hypothetical protein DBA20_15610 [Pandoraea capi]|nr:hypothetical protein [Pandoraea sp. LA3]MDN4584416.1 hypothetical protein [Pandoraea capi]